MVHASMLSMALESPENKQHLLYLAVGKFQICRICLKSKDLKLWQDFEHLKKLFQNLTGIKIDDGKTCDRYLCMVCIGYLQSIEEFIDEASYHDCIIKDALNFCDIKAIVSKQAEAHDDDSNRNDFYQSSENNNLNECKLNVDLIKRSSREEPMEGKYNSVSAAEEESIDPYDCLKTLKQEECEVEDYDTVYTPQAEEIDVDETELSTYDSLPIKREDDEETKTKMRYNTKPSRYRGRRKKSNKLRVPDHLRPFECPFCSRRFVQKGNMQTHIRLHTGEMPFQCTFCPEKFRQLSNLNQHIVTHTSNEMACAVCLRKFDTNEELLQHRSTHAAKNKQYVCYVCSKRFSYQWSLSSHLEIHKKEIFKKEQGVEDN